MIKEGRGLGFQQESEFSFSGKDDPDVLLGGHYDGETYYKVRVERIDDPDLFLTRDELRLVVDIINTKGGLFGDTSK
ncbi:MAG: hypothetical protein R3F17_01190 [Planctomycetota bacterium]